MRIVVDLQVAQTANRFGRQVLAWVQSLAKATHGQADREIYLLLNGRLPDSIEPLRAAFEGLLPQDRIVVWYAPGDCRHSQDAQLSALLHAACLASLAPDVLLLADDAGAFSPAEPVGDRFLNAWIPRCVIAGRPQLVEQRLSDAWRIFAASAHAREKIADSLGRSRDEIGVLPIAVSEDFCPHELAGGAAALRRKSLGILRPFVLCIGTGHADDNLAHLLQAYAALPARLRRCHQLVIAFDGFTGAPDGLPVTIENAALGDDEWVVIDSVDAAQRAELFRLCTLAVFPAQHDAGGSHLLEAMACGAAVIASNDASLPEWIALEEALFSPNSCFSISTALRTALEDSDLLERLRRHSRESGRRSALASSSDPWLLLIESCEKKPAHGERVARLRREIEALCQEALPLSRLSREDNQRIEGVLAQLAGSVPPRRLFVDISELRQRDARTGIQRRTRSILLELLKRPPTGYVVEPVYATADAPGYRRANEYLAHLHHETDVPAPDVGIMPGAGDIFLGLDLQQTIVCAQAETLRRMRRDGVTMAFVVDDLLPVLRPEYFPPGTDQAHAAWLLLLAEMDLLIGVSAAVAGELENWLEHAGVARWRPLRLGWVHNGADIASSAPSTGLPPEATETLQQLAARRTFLTLGTLEPRKGHRQILDAFECLWQKGLALNLVIVGKAGWLTEPLIQRLRAHPQLGRQLFVLEGVSDEYLEKVFAASTCLIAASHGEGFGLPLIEAAQHGLPLLVRDIPVFREVAGCHATYFQGNSADELAAAVEAWRAAFERGQAIGSAGMPWNTWQQSAERLKSLLLGELPLKTLPLAHAGRSGASRAAALPTLDEALERVIQERQARAAQRAKAQQQACQQQRQVDELQHSLLAARAEAAAQAECERQQVREQESQRQKLTAELQATRAQAQQQAERIDLILHSSSWRLTAPLRGFKTAWQAGRTAPRRLALALARRVVRQAISVVVARPRLKGWLLARIGRYPALVSRLRRLNHSGALPDHAAWAGASTRYEPALGLSPQADAVYVALLQAFEAEEPN